MFDDKLSEAFSVWLSKVLDAENKDLVLSFLPDSDSYRRRISRDSYPQYFRSFAQKHVNIGCRVFDKDAQQSTSELYDFLAGHLMVLAQKSKAIVSLSFPVKSDEGKDLSAFLLPEFKKFSVEDWEGFYPCALVCSLLGETGCAMVAVPSSVLRLNRYEKVRESLILSGLLRRVIYLNLGDRGMDEMTLLVFCGLQNNNQTIEFSRLERRGLRSSQHVTDAEKVEFDHRRIIDVASDALLQARSRLDEGEARHLRCSELLDSGLGELFSIEVVKSFFPPALYTAGRTAADSDEGKASVKASGHTVRRLTPSDFNSEGLLIPYNPSSSRQCVAKISPRSLEGRALMEGDVLVARIGRLNAAYIVPAVDPSSGIDAYIAGDNFIVLRAHRTPCAPLICALINGWHARYQLDAASSSSLRLSPSDLTELAVPDVFREEDLAERTSKAADEYYEARAALEKATDEYHRTMRNLSAIVEEATQRQDKRNQSTDSMNGRNTPNINSAN